MQRTTGHFNRQARLDQIRRRRGLKTARQLQDEQTSSKTTMGLVKDLHVVTTHIYSDDEIKKFNMQMAIDNHPLSRKPTNMRSKLAYKEIMTEVQQSPRYMLPGMFAI